MEKIKYQIIKIRVPESGSQVKFEADTNKRYQTVNGLFFSLPEEKAISGSTIGLRLNNDEIFPEEFEVKLITTGIQANTNNRFYDSLEVEAAGSRIEGKFIDSGKADIYPYTAKLYLRLIKKI